MSKNTFGSEIKEQHGTFEWIDYDFISILKSSYHCVSATIRKMPGNDLTHADEYRWMCGISIMDGNELCIVQPKNDIYGHCVTLDEAKRKVIISLREQVIEHVKFFCDLQKEICAI